MIMSVNCLPEGFTGQCNILLNDLDEIVAGRNVAILYLLLSAPDDVLEEVAELCVHLQYSAAFTMAQAAYVSRKITPLFWFNTKRGTLYENQLHFRGNNKFFYSLDDIETLQDMLGSMYHLVHAANNMHEVVLAPQRRDVLDKYLFSVRGSHRLGEMHMRETGVVLPFGASTVHFIRPNRSVSSMPILANSI